MTLYLLRHAQVQNDYKNCYNGWIDVDIELFNTQIKDIQNISFERVISSTLQRCKHTLDYLGYTNYEVDERIKEIKFKSFIEGKSFAQINPPSFALKDMQSWYNYTCDESINSFRERVNSFLKTLHGENILICTHAGTIRMILSIIHNEDFLDQFDKNIDYLDLIKVSIKK
jgi:broad specificity phosphatase PhoE